MRKLYLLILLPAFLFASGRLWAQCSPVITPSSPLQLTCGGDKGATLTVSASANTTTGTPATFEWFFNDSPTGVRGGSILADQTGNYKAKITNADPNCTDLSTSVLIERDPGQTWPTLTSAQASPDKVCKGISTTLAAFASGTGTVSYSWENNSVEISTDPVHPVIPTTTTTYKVKATDAATGCYASKFVTVTVNPLPDATISASTPSVCQNATQPPSVFFSASAGTSPYTYTYTVNGTPQTNQTQSQISVPTGSAGNVTYTLQSVSDANGCVQTSFTQPSSVTVKINPLPGGTVSSTTPVVCKDASQPSVTFTGSAGPRPYTFTYTLNGGAQPSITTVSPGDMTTVTVPTATADDFIYALQSVSDSNGCIQTSFAQPSSVTVKVRPLPGATVTPSASVVCKDATQHFVTFTGSTGSGKATPYTFTHTLNNGAALSLPTDPAKDTISTSVPTGALGSQTYQLYKVRDGNGCEQTFIPPVSAVVNVVTGPALTSVKDTTVCSGVLFSYNAGSSTSGITGFSWERHFSAPPDSIRGSGPATGLTGVVSDTLRNASSYQPFFVAYVFTLMNASTTCTNTDTLKVRVNPIPVLKHIDSKPYCTGSTVPPTPFSSSALNSSFTWTNSNVYIGFGLGTNGTTAYLPGFIANPTKPDTTQIIVNVTAGLSVSCPGKSDTFQIFVRKGPVLKPPKDTSICDSVFFRYKAEPDIDKTGYSWTRILPPNGEVISRDSSNGKDSIKNTLDNTTSKPWEVKYAFTLTAPASTATCTGYDTLRVTVNPTPFLNHIPDTTVCSGTLVDSILFNTASPNPAYTWTNSDTTIGLRAGGITTRGLPAFIATNNTDAPVTATVNVSIKASAIACEGKGQPFKITVNPSPRRPGFTSLSRHPDGDSLQLCTDSRNVNFNVSSLESGVGYKWTAFPKGDALSIGDTIHPNTVISFFRTGIDTVKVTATNKYNCSNAATQVVNVNTTTARIDSEKIFLKQPGNLLVYPDNSLSGYQWGVDAALLPLVSPPVYGPSQAIPGQVYQFFVPAGTFIVHDTLDTTGYRFWVLLQKGSCLTKVYYNGPFANRRVQSPRPDRNDVELQLFPNPNQGSFEITLKGAIYGKVEAKIYDALGHVVFRKSFDKYLPEVTQTFTAGYLPPGLYFLELLSSDLKKASSRFVVQ